MQTRTKLFIDRLIGVPIAWGLNLAARVLGRVLGRNHAITPGNVRTIVFAKYVGMGSIVQATPLVRSVRARFPDATIVFLTNRSSRRLVERLDHVDRILEVDDRGLLALAVTTTRALATLVRLRVDLFFDLEVYSSYGSLVSLLSLARNRLGFYRRSAEHKIGTYTHLMYLNARQPVRQVYLQLARAVGCEAVEPDRLGPIHVHDADRAEIRSRLATWGAEPGRVIVMTPNADLMSERRLWPVESFAALAAQVVEHYDTPVLLTGVASERAYVQTIVDRVPAAARARVHNVAGELSLGALFGLLECARCLVTIDTGPMHMAWALGTPTVCLFGPGDPVHYGWNGPGVEILYEPIYCSPCLYETDEPPCHGDNLCMKRIRVASVRAAMDRVLAAPMPDRTVPVGPEFYLDDQGKPVGRVVRGSLEAPPLVR